MSVPQPEPVRASLSGSLAVAAAHLPSVLVTKERADRLVSLASGLPPLHMAGFECRLAAGDEHVDLQQGITAGEDGPEKLSRYLNWAGRTFTGPAWQRLAQFAEEWRRPGTALHEGVFELWLEFDTPVHAVGSGGELIGSSQPSLIALLRRDEAGRTGRAVIEALVEGHQQAPLLSALKRCAAACPEGSRVSHVGVMLGREATAMRLNVSDLPLDEFPSFLGNTGWPGDASAVRSLARELLLFGDELVLCLDVVGDFLPRAGLECFFADRSHLDMRWELLLEHLVEMKLCQPEKAQALLAWPGRDMPSTSKAPWPEDLVVMSFTQPVERSEVIERRLSHVKLSWAAGAVSAKAYFGFAHLSGDWRKTAASGPKTAAPPSARSSATPALASRPLPGSRSLAAALDRAVIYLLANRNQGGWWRDFSDRRARAVGERAMGSTSDEWVSAYVAGVIAATSREAADQTLELLLSRRQGQAGWGYHALVPPDADTTTCVLRLAERLGRHDEERFAAARRFVSHLVAPSGGLATYDAAAAAPLSHYMGLETTFEGWCSVHTCVTAAAATLELPVRPRLVGYLARSQREDGGWSGYWWDDDEYTTALACEALAMTAEDHGPALVRASAWAERRIGPDGAVSSVATSSKSAFATALALRSMVSCASGGARPDAAERAIAWLLATQNEDGGWPPSARLRIPEPRSIDPLAMPATTVTYIDEGVFTTATVLSGLAAALVWEPPAP